MVRERLKGNLDLLLLTVLTGSPGHGYEIADRLRRRSGGAFDLPEGTIYPALHRLEARNWVSSTWQLVDGRRRRVYEPTVRGRRHLDAQRREWQAFVASMTTVLGGGLIDSELHAPSRTFSSSAGHENVPLDMRRSSEPA